MKCKNRKIQMLNAITLEVLETFNSIKEAESKTNIHASTIYNVLSKGFSSRNYLYAGNLKWQYENEINKKYLMNRKEYYEYSLNYSNNLKNKKMKHNY